MDGPTGDGDISPAARGPRRWGPRRPPPDPERERAERRARRAVEDQQKRTRIEAGDDPRQPPEYRGVVFDHADADGVHPTAFPPLRHGPQDSLSEEFIAFQHHNQTRVETHPHYYCVRCRIRYNARDGGMCGPCIGKSHLEQARQTPLFADVAAQPVPPEYPT